jgi:hypothetical protein
MNRHFDILHANRVEVNEPVDKVISFEQYVRVDVIWICKDPVPKGFWLAVGRIGQCILVENLSDFIHVISRDLLVLCLILIHHILEPKFVYGYIFSYSIIWTKEASSLSICWYE